MQNTINFTQDNGLTDKVSLLVHEDPIQLRTNGMKKIYIGKLWSYEPPNDISYRFADDIAQIVDPCPRTTDIYLPPHTAKLSLTPPVILPTPPTSPPVNKQSRLSSFINLKHFKSLHNDKGPCYTYILNPEGCPYKDDCVYMHVTFDSEGMRQYLAYIRKQPCPEGNSCTAGSACPWGHACPEGAACTYTMCRFKVKFGTHAHPTKPDAAIDVAWRKNIPAPAPPVEVKPQPVDVLKPLEDVLRELRISKDFRPLRSKIGIKLNQEIYNAAGCQYFKEYAEKARHDPRFEFGGEGGKAWVHLRADAEEGDDTPWITV